MQIQIEKSPELARIIADLTGDGHLQYDGKRGVIFFYSKNLGTIKSFNQRFNHIFNSSGKIRKVKNTGKSFTLRYKIYFSSKNIAKILYDLGTPTGNKSNKIFSIPSWILNGNEDVKKQYLKGIYTCEGSVYPTKEKNGFRWRIELEQYKNEKIKNEGQKFMVQIKKLLEEFGVQCSPVRYGKKQKRKDDTFSIAIKLDIEKSSFSSFNKQIGFDDKFKTKKLLDAIAG